MAARENGSVRQEQERLQHTIDEDRRAIEQSREARARQRRTAAETQEKLTRIRERLRQAGTSARIA
jgi:hypothetical protein